MQKLLTFVISKTLGLYINILSYIYPKKASWLAYKFFSHPRDGRLIKEALPDVLKEADAEMITHNDFLFQIYTWKGNDTKVLLMHGWESNASRWELLIGHLQKSGTTIIAIDAPAHGLSSGSEFSMPRYAEFVNVAVQKFKPDYLVGHSLGGATALYFQSHYQNEYIKKLVTLGAPCDLNTLLKNYAGILSLNSNVFQLLEKHFFEHYKIKTHEFSGSVFASKIKIEGLIAHDVHDTVVSFKEAEKIAKAWPDAKFVTTKGLGHSMHGDALYNSVYDFLFENKKAEW
ncbi:alpha/beta hydrolase [Flavobacterium sp. AG291]|uniref:alpha/beta hydrolase n=1 Tax=Flavobacterium sp. AG291 TaxID=2184000 RepID=UPI000E0B5871|nr:alpha/beta hydrolase [Flavobacterium sp. AG291]RDI12095.1 alpha/beta hydrolase family protein [Flavobacterium sp. AG291]